MRLDRNINEDGAGKYMLVRQRRVREILAQNDGMTDDLKDALATLREFGVLDNSAEGWFARMAESFRRDGFSYTRP